MIQCQHLATDCTDVPERRVYLDGVPKGQDLCSPCVAYAERAGMNPVADRRAVARIPAWRQRDMAKDLTRQTGAA